MKKIALLSVAILASQCAFAESYLGLQVGQVGFDGYHNNPIKSHDSKHWKRIGGRISAGHLWPMQQECIKLGVETGFQANRRINVIDNALQKMTYSRWSMDLLGVADFYATEKLDLFAKAGAAVVHEKMASTSVLGSDSLTLVPKAAFGVGYDVTPSINTNLSMMQEFHAGKANSTNAIMIGMKVKLP